MALTRRPVGPCNVSYEVTLNILTITTSHCLKKSINLFKNGTKDAPVLTFDLVLPMR